MTLPKIKMERPSVYNGLDWLVKALSLDDFNLNRIVFVEPGKPIPDDQLMRTYQWMVSWNLIDAGHEVQDLVNTDVMRHV